MPGVFAWTPVLNGYCTDWQPVTGIQGSKTFTAGEGRRLQDIRAIYPRSWERSSKFHSESADAASPCDPFPANLLRGWQAGSYVFERRSALRYYRCTSPQGALVACELCDEILNSGQKKSGRLCRSPFPKFMAALTGTTETPGPFIFMAQCRLHLV